MMRTVPARDGHIPIDVLVECWGVLPDDGSASQLAQEVAKAVESMVGEFAGGYVAGAGVEGGPSDSPDPQTDRPRALLTVKLLTYPF